MIGFILGAFAGAMVGIAWAIWLDFRKTFPPIGHDKLNSIDGCVLWHHTGPIYWLKDDGEVGEAYHPRCGGARMTWRLSGVPKHNWEVHVVVDGAHFKLDRLVFVDREQVVALSKAFKDFVRSKGGQA